MTKTLVLGQKRDVCRSLDMRVSIGISSNTMRSLFLVFCLAEFNRINAALKTM